MAQDKKDRIKIDAPIDHIASLLGLDRDEPLQSKIPEPVDQLPQSKVAELSKAGRQSMNTVNTPAPTVNPIRQPDESVFQRLNTLLGNPPTRDQYKPSKLRRFAGGLVGGAVGASQGAEAGMRAGSGIAEQPYREAYQDWATRTGALKESADIELNRQKAGYSGISDLASYMRAKFEQDPEAQSDVAGAKSAATAAGKAPYTKLEEERKQRGRIALEEIRTEREKMRLGSQRQISQAGITSREKEGAANRSAREKLARESINSKENIARLNRELRAQLASSKNQRVAPNQQFLARLMAENEISQLVSDPKELENIFVKDKKTGNYRFKPDAEVPGIWKEKRDTLAGQVTSMYNRIIGKSFNPKADVTDDEEWDIDESEPGMTAEDEDEEENEYEIEDMQ